ncbi:MAG: hypothetical protein U5M23_02400 [Marinagarivorans sp.]|nr:hypothetical protein [Marinagarivorans sp.]
MFVPIIGGGHNNAAGKRLFAGCGKEAVYVALLYAVIFCIAFALNGVVFVGALGFGYKVYTGIAGIYTLLFCPIAIESYIAV